MRQFTLTLFFFSTLFLCTALFAEDSCHPAIDPSRAQYIVGYGSLMNENSVKQTDAYAGPNIPIELFGFQRRWGVVPQRSKFEMYVGIIQRPNQLMNASLFRLSQPEVLSQFDNRENGYCRQSVESSSLRVLINEKNPSGQYWLYIPHNHLFRYPSDKSPISQAYVDVFLSGCIAMDEKYNLTGFAKQCILTTTEWHPSWSNNRQPARRAFVTKSDMKKVDALLKEMLLTLYEKLHITQ